MKKERIIERIDWNKVWKSRYLAHNASEGFRDGLHLWKHEEAARRYDRLSRGEYGRRIRETLGGLLIPAGSRVLDIGSGPGTLAIPLASRAAGVTAVEPAEGMRSVFRSAIETEGIKNIRIVEKKWEDVDPIADLDGPYDVVIASLSLSFPDIRAAVENMQEVCTGVVNLYWFVDMPFWERNYCRIWPALHGSPYRAGPKVDCLWMVLFQMGIYPGVKMMTLDKSYRFVTKDEMYDHFRGRFGVEGPVKEKIMKNYLDSIIREENGAVTISGDSTYAKIWWNVNRTGRRRAR
jgi:SAM-dependent methyltransferase